MCDYCMRIAEREVMRDISLAVDELRRLNPRLARHLERCIVARDGAVGYFPELDQ